MVTIKLKLLSVLAYFTRTVPLKFLTSLTHQKVLATAIIVISNCYNLLLFLSKQSFQKWCNLENYKDQNWRTDEREGVGCNWSHPTPHNKKELNLPALSLLPKLFPKFIH